MAWTCPDCSSKNVDADYPNCAYVYLHKQSNHWWQCGYCGAYNDDNRALCKKCGTDKNKVEPRATG